MNTTNQFSRGILRFIVLSLLATICTAGAATERFSIIITPRSGGYVLWQTSTPIASGSMGKTGSFTFNKYALVDLTFKPNTGYTLGRVMELTEGPVTLDGNNHAQFGPVDHSPTFIARFNPPTPTGVYVVSSTNNALAAVIGDISGVYSGTTPLTLTKVARTYDMTVAEDDRGKLSAMGTIQGLQQKPTTGTMTSNLDYANVGGIVTISGTPTGQLRMAINGAVDGKPIKGSGSAQTPLVLATGTATAAIAAPMVTSTPGLNITASFRANFNGTLVAAKNAPYFIPVGTPAQSQFKKNWSLNLSLIAKYTKSGAEYVEADAYVTLPNQQSIIFPIQKVKYSAKTGYRLNLTHGKTNPGGKPGKHTSILIRNMTMTQSAGKWVITGGTINYKFLGQSGTANLIGFL